MVDCVQGLACVIEVLKIKRWSLVKWRRMFGLQLQRERLSLWCTNLSLFLKLRRLTGLWKAASILGRYCLCHDYENHANYCMFICVHDIPYHTFGSFEFGLVCYDLRILIKLWFTVLLIVSEWSYFFLLFWFWLSSVVYLSLYCNTILSLNNVLYDFFAVIQYKG